VKICEKCRVPKSLDDFHKSKSEKDGRQRRCKLCKSNWEKEHKEEKKIKNAAYYKVHGESIRKHVKEYAIANKDYIKSWRQKYNQKRKEQHRAYINERRKRLGRGKPWAGKKAADRRYYRANKQKFFDYAAQRRAWENNPLLHHERIRRHDIFARDNFICHICKKKVRKGDLSIDHLIPVSKGGRHISENLATAHLRCNIGRGAGRKPAQLRLFG
jgi:hypothetical protein